MSKTIQIILIFLLLPILLIGLPLMALGSATQSQNEKTLETVLYYQDLSSCSSEAMRSALSIVVDEFKQMDSSANEDTDLVYAKVTYLYLYLKSGSRPFNSERLPDYLACFTTGSLSSDLDSFSQSFNYSLSDSDRVSIDSLNDQAQKLLNEKMNDAWLIGVIGEERIQSSLLSEPPEFPFSSPIAGDWTKKVTSEFGTRDPITLSDGTVTSAYHTGLDLGESYGKDIYAISDGTVIVVREDKTGLGLYCVIDHGGGIFSAYGHTSAITVTEGENVIKGQKIGEVGSSGWSTGTHLHLEIIRDHEAVNPRKYLKLNE